MKAKPRLYKAIACVKGNVAKRLYSKNVLICLAADCCAKIHTLNSPSLIWCWDCVSGRKSHDRRSLPISLNMAILCYLCRQTGCKNLSLRESINQCIEHSFSRVWALFSCSDKVKL